MTETPSHIELEIQLSDGTTIGAYCPNIGGDSLTEWLVQGDPLVGLCGYKNKRNLLYNCEFDDHVREDGWWLSTRDLAQIYRQTLAEGRRARGSKQQRVMIRKTVRDVLNAICQTQGLALLEVSRLLEVDPLFQAAGSQDLPQSPADKEFKPARAFKRSASDRNDAIKFAKDKAVEEVTQLPPFWNERRYNLSEIVPAFVMKDVEYQQGGKVKQTDLVPTVAHINKLLQMHGVLEYTGFKQRAWRLARTDYEGLAFMCCVHTRQSQNPTNGKQPKLTAHLKWSREGREWLLDWWHHYGWKDYLRVFVAKTKKVG